LAYKVRFVNPGKLYGQLKPELDAAYFRVMETGNLIDREDLWHFEEELAKFVGTKHAVGLNSGYDSLHMSLRACGIGPGDEVIVPAHTFVATASAVVNVGARPVLVDVGRDFNIAVDRVEEAVTSRTRGIIPVHLNGRMAYMPAVMEIAEKHGLAVVEDACQSLGASQDGRKAGAWGVTGCWSFYPFKILGGYGDGGAITTNSDEVADFARRMRFNGEDRHTGEYHGHGFTCLLDNIQAAFLAVKLRYMPAWIEKRKTIAERYRDAFREIDDLALPHFNGDGRKDVFQNYVVRSRQGDRFSDHLRANGVEVLVQWRKPYYRHAALQLEDRGFPETELLSSEVCSLPMAVELDDDDVDFVIKTVRSFYGLS
jgi:dTDP-4-amino-4,6-dideoxygalactose transaminase